jgi:serine/threonine-protein kinase ATR
MGMAKGAKDADPTMRVLPAHFGNLDDNLQRFNASHIRYLDALNVHAYSWMQTLVGRTGVHPEHNMSTIHEVNDLIRFRDAALPGMPIFLTEWGWDSAGGGEDCNPPAGVSGTASPVCVTEAAQALYAVRGALMLARKGLQRLTWFFYGNLASDAASWPSVKGLFSRSGLRSSPAAGYKLKQSYYALKDFIASLGATNFQAAIREDHDAFVYLLANGTNPASHIVAWRPVDAGVLGSINVSFTTTSFPVSAWSLGFASMRTASLPLLAPMQWTMSISVYPTVVALK